MPEEAINLKVMFRYAQDHLDLATAVALIQGKGCGTINEKERRRIRYSRGHVISMLKEDRSIYGINTGFGPLCDTKIKLDATRQLQRNLLLSHAVGVGQPISKQISKLMLICKLQALSKAYSGVREELIDRIQLFLANDWIPVVPEQGSVGASGDLAPLAHLFLPLIGEGEFWIDGKIIPAYQVLKNHDIQPLQLEAKEGLALINGTQFILAHTIIGLDKMRYLLDLADLAGAMSLDAFQGSLAPFKAALHELRPFAGTQLVAKRIRALLQDSEIMQAHANCNRVQDPYSMRCIPQVHGASRNAWQHLKDLAEIELNSITDNPIILNAKEAISGGNFHGQPLALALDYCSLAAAELGNISDRRSYLLLEGKNGLPRMLTAEDGLNSGLMIPQYTTAALVTENKSLCFPPSADSIPTSLGQKDHVSMGRISTRKFNQILGNLEKILAIELLYVAQGIDFRRPLKSSAIIEENHSIIRQRVTKLNEDRLLKEDIKEMIALVQERKLIVTT